MCCHVTCHHAWQVRELNELGDGEELIVRQKALLAARELLATQINSIQCISAGITPAVVNLLGVSAIMPASSLYASMHTCHVSQPARMHATSASVHTCHTSQRAYMPHQPACIHATSASVHTCHAHMTHPAPPPPAWTSCICYCRRYCPWLARSPACPRTHPPRPPLLLLLLPPLPQDADATCRERAAGTLECLALREVGARDIIQHGGIAQLVVCLQDSVLTVRNAAYKALIEASRFDCTRNALTALGTALPLLIQHVLREQHQRSLYGLTLLNACVQVGSRGLGFRVLACRARRHRRRVLAC